MGGSSSSSSTCVIAPGVQLERSTWANAKDVALTSLSAAAASQFTITAGACAGDCPWSRGEKRQFEGLYTIVNKANGRRMLASSRAGFSATSQWPIYKDHRWRLLLQDNHTYAIVNAVNGMRILAQPGFDYDNGFFAIDNGPVYQDQRWRLVQQTDGSYVIVNEKSERRIVADSGGDWGIGFGAVNSSSPLRDDQMWWIISQETDESANLALRLAHEKEMFATSLRELEAELATSHSKCIRTQRSEEQLLRPLGDFRADAEGAAAESAAELPAHRESRDRLAEELAQCSDALGRAEEQLCKDDAGQSASPCCVENAGFVAACGILSVALLAALAGICKVRARCTTARVDLERLANDLQAEKEAKAQLGHSLLEQSARASMLEQELAHEVGGMLRAGDTNCELGFDFGYQIFDMGADEERVRLVKVQCPGVDHGDVEVALIFNGCDVTVRRRASCGVGATTWTRRFQFRPSDGLFEFREDQMQLEHGFLQLVFRRCTFQTRMIRFPQHFSLATTDQDQCWEYAVECATDGATGHADAPQSTAAESSVAAEGLAGDAASSSAAAPRKPIPGLADSSCAGGTESTASTPRAVRPTATR